MDTTVDVAVLERNILVIARSVARLVYGATTPLDIFEVSRTHTRTLSLTHTHTCSLLKTRSTRRRGCIAPLSKPGPKENTGSLENP